VDADLEQPGLIKLR